MRHTHPATPRLGIDIGRVIIGAADEDGEADTSFLSQRDEDAIETPPVGGALDTIALLTERFEGQVWLVSKCGPRIQALTRRWLAHQRFFERTGIAHDHVRFCLKRPEKRLHAVELRLTHFIDDRLDVHTHLRGVVPELYLFGHQKRPAPDWVVHVRTWQEVRKVLLRDHEVLGRDVIDEPHRRAGHA
jgi:hypothetical protein